MSESSETSPRPDETPGSQRSPAPFPPAELRSAVNMRTHLWWLTALSLVVAIALVVFEGRDRGPAVVVEFVDGHGIKTGDSVRYRGISVGEVTAVRLTESAGGVELEIVLIGGAAGLAREGTRFWIERPRVSLARVSGLETIVGANYVGVAPGPAGGPPRASFRGVAIPPTLADAEATAIEIRFQDGHGLAEGDPLKHRGIVVGEVTAIDLSADLAEVVVRVRVAGAARRLARAGSQFWIERPRLGLTAVGGLETLVSGRFLAVLPGLSTAPVQTEFAGREQPAVLPQRREGGLEVILEGPERYGLSAGSVITYRGIPIGSVTSMGLSSGAVGVEARAYIEPRYRSLVRESSHFWSISGVEVSLGWTGVELEVDSLAALAQGGVAMATLDAEAPAATTGDRFRLEPEPEDAWLEADARIAVGTTLLPGGAALPRPVRASRRWQERSFGFLRTRQRDAWVLPVGRLLLGPATLFEAAAEGETGVVLALAGRELTLSEESVTAIGAIAFLALPSGEGFKDPWPTDRLRYDASPEDCVVVGDPNRASFPLSAGELSAPDAANDRHGWEISPSVPIGPDWVGACVVSRRDGAMIGVVIAVDSGMRVAPLIAPR